MGEKETGCSGGPAFSRKAAELWKSVPDASKAPFEEEYKSAKQKYDAYLKTPEGQKAQSELKEQRKEKKEADVKKDARKAAKAIEKDDKLKKPQTAYWIWLGANRAKIVEAAGSAAAPAVGKKGGEMWNNLPAAEKKPFEDEAKKQKETYDTYLESEEGKAAMAAYKAATKEAKEAVTGPKKRKAEEMGA